MDKLRREIARLQAAILEYDRALPYAEGWREKLLLHRNWDLQILAGLTRQLLHAPESLK